jgi:2-polyprenyl-3-methyl-5-hydroxy-6-metoxy-1,4-benzoquinol methylase
MVVEEVDIKAGREGVPGVYAFFARYLLMPWQSCLDVGGGLGRGKAILLRRSKYIRSIDIEPALEKYGVVYSRVEDENTAGFDWCIAVDVIEHVKDDEHFLSELLRVARRGVFVSTPNRLHHPEHRWSYHVREYSPEELRKLFQKVAPDYAIIHFSCEIYGGNMRMRLPANEDEHQAILCFKEGGKLYKSLLRLRELILNLCRSKY